MRLTSAFPLCCLLKGNFTHWLWLLTSFNFLNFLFSIGCAFPLLLFYCFLLDRLALFHWIWKPRIQWWGNVLLETAGSEANGPSLNMAPWLLGSVYYLERVSIWAFASWVLAIMPKTRCFPCSCWGGYLSWPWWQPLGAAAVVHSLQHSS